MSDDQPEGGAPKASPHPDTYPEPRGVTRAANPFRTSFVTAIARGFSESDLLDVRASTLRLAREFDPDARVIQRSDIAFEIRLRAGEAPVVVLVEALPQGQEPPLSEGHLEASRRVVVATSVRDGTLALKVVPRSWVDRVLLALRLRRELATGDGDFDAFFVVRGADGASSALLSPAARGALLRLAREAPPCLECGEGAVEVRWYVDPTEAALRAAVEVAAAVRRT